MTYANGDVYEGHFLNGLKHGSGVKTNDDGSIYKGEYKDDKPHG